MIPEEGHAVRAVRPRERPLQALGIVHVGRHHFGGRPRQFLRFLRLHVARDCPRRETARRIVQNRAYQAAALCARGAHYRNDFLVSHGTHDTLLPILPTTPDRPIGLLHATAMVVGIIIGASIFVQPSEINRHVPTVSGVLSVWLAAGILTLFGPLVCAQLPAPFPRTGGVYVFLTETLSPACGFLWGWAMFWSAHSGIIAASSVILARYVAFFVPLDDTGIRAVAIAAILLFSFVNYLGVRQGSTLQTVVTISKVAAILLLLGMAAILATPATHPLAAPTPPPPSSLSADGTWSPTLPAKPATLPAPSRAPSSSARSPSPCSTSCSTPLISTCFPSAASSPPRASRPTPRRPSPDPAARRSSPPSSSSPPSACSTA